MRRAWATLLALASVATWGQSLPSLAPGSSHAERVRHSQLETQLNLVQGMAMRGSRAAPLTEAEKAVRAVIDGVVAGDCPGAVTKLNAGLAKAFPEIHSLAGAMYEEGLCLKPNWDRALAFYEKAISAGLAGTAARVAAGYAAPIGGRDFAAALWWAVRAKTPMPGPCAQVAPLAADADKFVAALNAWPAGQLNACAYAAAVMASVQSDAESPGLAADYGLEGTIQVRLAPAEGRIDISDALQAAGSASGGDAVAAKQAIAAHLRQVADRALKRFDKPAGIAADWRADAQFALKIVR